MARSRYGSLQELQTFVVYNDEWRADPNAYPLSLSMPLASAEHGHARIEAFLWGLLPDNDRVLENWAGVFRFHPRMSFGDCPRG